MKYIQLLLVSILFCSCQNKKSDIGSDTFYSDEINEIVETIIIQDSLNVFKNYSNSDHICRDLRKLTVEVPIPNDDGLIYPPLPGNIYITELFSNGKDENLFFSSMDSTFILAQNSNHEKFQISKVIAEDLNISTFNLETAKSKTGQNYNFFQISIPIFSRDGLNAYVQLDYRCGYLCGNGKDIFLKKINEKWKIIAAYKSWIS